MHRPILRQPEDHQHRGADTNLQPDQRPDRRLHIGKVVGNGDQSYDAAHAPTPPATPRRSCRPIDRCRFAAHIVVVGQCGFCIAVVDNRPGVPVRDMVRR